MPRFLAVILIAVNLQRQLLCRPEYFAGFVRNSTSPVEGQIFRIATAFDPTRRK